MKKTIPFLLTLFLFSNILTAKQKRLPGAAWHTTGFGASALASGGATANGRLTVADVIANPANLAASEQTLLELTGGLFGSEEGLAGLGLSLPTSFGVMSFNALWSLSQDATNQTAGTGLGLRTSFSKEITPHFHFGLGLNLIHVLTSPDELSRFGVAADLGMVILQNGSSEERARSRAETGFGLFDFAFSASFNNLGLNPAWDDWGQHPDMHLTAGFALTYFKSEILKIKNFHDLSLSFDDFSIRYSTGLGFGFFDAIWLRGGLMAGNQGAGLFTMGASIDLRQIFGDTGFDLSWAWVPFDYHGQNQSGHLVSLSLVLSGLDDEAPFVSVSSTNSHFSPNFDGVKDTINLKFKITDNRLLKGWRIILRNQEGREIRSLVSHGEADTELSFGKFFELLFSSRSSVPVPETWEWNGTDHEGKVVPDGIYTCEVEAWDARENHGRTEPLEITVNTQQPEAELGISLTLFSPDGDGNKDITIIEQITGGRDTRWTGRIINEAGQTVRQFDWGEGPPASFPWDGKDDQEEVVPDGNYEYRLEGQDLAGNKTTKKISQITVSTRKRPINLKLVNESFSPNNDGLRDQLIMLPEVTEPETLQNWELVIAKTNGEEVYRVKSEQRIPEKIVWDGKDARGDLVPDGVYLASLKAEYPEGDQPSSFPRKFTLDTEGPEIRLSASPKLFSPDGDGENDQLKIMVQLKDRSEITEWQVVIRQGDQVFKTFGGENPRSESFTIIWDGKSDQGELVESATTYTIDARASDEVGNLGQADQISTDVDILVIKTARGLKIMITNIEFAYDQWDLASPDSPVLNRVADVLKRYSEYKIIIEGHTDGIGAVDYNLMLSTRRARTVLRYLLQRGIEDNRMLAKGLGMSTPIADNSSEEGRAKNRRVEFILVKDE